MKKLLLSAIFGLCYLSLFSQSLKSKSLKNYSGFFNFYYEEATDKIFLEVKDLDKEFLYVNSLSSGVGSNDIGLDRGQLGQDRVVKFQKAGNKLLLVQPNQRYRAITDNELERRSIEQAFAKSVLYGFKIVEKNNDAYIIDLTPFLMQDAHGVVQRLKQRKEGTYKLDASKSALSLERTKAFPKNVEFEALLTFSGTPSGRNIRSVTPTSQLVSVIQHHSFVELPDDDYKMREFDVRSGAISFYFLDYATPVFEDIKKRYIIRHRLEKKNPNAALSEAVEPIIYYLDPGTPEPVRSALLEGGRWWNEAFEAIGFKDAFQVKMLPANADPMDCRYNVIQWVHRSTRGWSYGASVVDPRTGEIIKGHVSLGSLRIRQDFMIAQALMNKPFAERDDNYQPMLEMALARIRQLSAHEIGHTIGFAHNFAASANSRASVMDYPHPTLKLVNGEVDFSDAYDTGIGEWDKVTVAYSYSEFEDGENEKQKLNEILENAHQQGLRFITDMDARPQGGAHSLAHLWDNGKSASEELENVLAIREKAISNFSADNIRDNEPYSKLEDVFVPLYFFHRYQVEATSKLLGGLDYNYAVKGDDQHTVKIVSAEEQREALNALKKALSLNTLAIPKEKLELFPPRAFQYNRDRESFKSNNSVGFDPFGAAYTNADMTLGLILNAERANRIIQQKSLDNAQLGLDELLSQLINLAFDSKPNDAYLKEVNEMLKFSLLQNLMSLSQNDKAILQTKAHAMEAIRKITLKLGTSTYDLQYAHMISRFLEEPDEFKRESPPQIPDGSPIGSDICTYNDN